MADHRGALGDTSSDKDDRKFAKLFVRIRSSLYDSMVYIVSIPLVIFFATSSGSESGSRIIGTIGVLLIVLYEPLLVSVKGGTLGHIACNLRVVDDRTNGNVSFFKAFARFLIKVLLGLFSFVTMMASSRQRAIHDALTDSTVQVRDVSRIRGQDFASLDKEPRSQELPSAWWRFFGILVYSALSYAAVSFLLAALLWVGVFSFNCVDQDKCNFAENLIFAAAGIGWFAILFVIIGYGWRGRLYGFRLQKRASH